MCNYEYFTITKLMCEYVDTKSENTRDLIMQKEHKYIDMWVGR